MLENCLQKVGLFRDTGKKQLSFAIQPQSFETASGKSSVQHALLGAMYAFLCEGQVAVCLAS